MNAAFVVVLVLTLIKMVYVMMLMIVLVSMMVAEYVMVQEHSNVGMVQIFVD